MNIEMKLMRPNASCTYEVRRARVAFWLAVLLALPVGAQNVTHGSLPQPLGQPVGGSLAERDDGNLDLAEQQQRWRALNEKRQKNIVSDTNKLLKLAGELDMEVKGLDWNEFTPQQLHKIAEIEKLAHGVKDKMSYSIKSPTLFEPTVPFQRR
jgi:hypothetical protein